MTPEQQEKINKMRDYHRQAKELVDEITTPKLIEGAEHHGLCRTIPQALMLELYGKLGQVLEIFKDQQKAGSE